jgi:hypothetical protein
VLSGRHLPPLRIVSNINVTPFNQLYECLCPGRLHFLHELQGLSYCVSHCFLLLFHLVPFAIAACVICYMCHNLFLPGRLCCLRELWLCCASEACLDGGLLALGFLPCLSTPCKGELVTAAVLSAMILHSHPSILQSYILCCCCCYFSGRLRCLRELELCCASQACLDGGLLALGFLPRLSSLSVSFDIHPASPCCLSELPAGLASLKLGSMWLEGLPQQLSELTGGY